MIFYTYTLLYLSSILRIISIFIGFLPKLYWTLVECSIDPQNHPSTLSIIISSNSSLLSQPKPKIKFPLKNTFFKKMASKSDLECKFYFGVFKNGFNYLKKWEIYAAAETVHLVKIVRCRKNSLKIKANKNPKTPKNPSKSAMTNPKTCTIKRRKSSLRHPHPQIDDYLSSHMKINDRSRLLKVLRL